MGALARILYLSAILIVCWALTLGLTWAPCYSQVCPENYHPLGTRMHIVAYYGLLASIMFSLLFRASNRKFRTLSQHHLTRREVPILRKRISVGGLIFAVWVLGVVLATTAFWVKPLRDYWTARFVPTGWAKDIPKLVVTGVFAHHADILLGLLLIPVGRNSVLGRAFNLHQHTLLYAHKLFAYLTVLSVLVHGLTYYTFVAAWMAKPWQGHAREKLAIDLENPNIALTDIKRIGIYYAVSLFTGTLTCALMLAIVVSSLPTLRRRAYNTFYYLHLILGSLILIGAGIHSSTNFYFMLPGLFLWIVDWVWRLFRGDTGLVQNVDGTLEDAGNGWLRILLPPCVKKLPPALADHLDDEAGKEAQMVAHPLQTYYLNIPSISKLQNHAFSVAAVGSPTTGPIFLFQRTSMEGKSERKKKRMMKRQWTWKVGKLTSKADGDEPSRTRSLRMRVEGPYFPPDREFETADRIICLVGGTGVTGALSLASWFLAYRMRESKASFTVIWSIRNASMALLPEWQDMMARSLQTNGRIRLRIHISSEYGRLDVNGALRGEITSDGHAAQGSGWVYISGPAGFLTAAEDACCDVQAEMKTAKKGKAKSVFVVDALSYFVAKWEV